MNNKQIFPFERNRYYPGKALTTKDFQTEQSYMNGKRRFINNMIFGKGILCGLNVVNLDDLSLLIESGAAIDGLGREIVMDKTVVRKLSTIEGYNELESDTAILYIRYKENELQPVYCVGTDDKHSGDEYENNWIGEGYELFLKGISEEDSTFAISDEFLSEETIYEDENYRLYVKFPSVIAKESLTKIELIVRKKTMTHSTLSLESIIKLPVFTSENGKHELMLEINGITIDKDETYKKEYWVDAHEAQTGETMLILPKDNIHVSIDGEEAKADTDINLRVIVDDTLAEQIVTREMGKLSLELREMNRQENAVALAKVTLTKTDVTYLIGKIEENNVKKYIAAINENERREKYRRFFRDKYENRTLRPILENKGSAQMDIGSQSGTYMESGILEIPLERDMKKGDIAYSEEIMHGLGKGNVYVDVGIVGMEFDKRINNDIRTVVYGESGLFNNPNEMEVKTAVAVYPDKGSFQVAVKLLGEQKSVILQVRWVAIKFVSPEEWGVLPEIETARIVPVVSAARMSVKETYFFDVRFEGMKPSRLCYELTESGSGEIGADGIYEAPGKEGVYEIHIFCANNPEISTYVYAIVSK